MEASGQHPKGGSSVNRTGRRLVLGTLLALGMLLAAGLLFPGCGSDDFPKAKYTIRIQDGSFFPTPQPVPVGSTVRWVNILPRSADNVRTVTSGSPGDSTAGALFDATLEGRGDGETEGDDFIYRFDERGTFPYFSRYPDPPSLVGTVVVQ
jgi:plastocyanin